MSVPFLFSSSVFSVFASKSPCWFRYVCHHGDHRTGTPDSPWPGSWRWFLWWTPGRNGRTASAVGQRSAPPSCFAEMTEQKGLFGFCFSPEHSATARNHWGNLSATDEIADEWRGERGEERSWEEREERREERGGEERRAERRGERRGECSILLLYKITKNSIFGLKYLFRSFNHSNPSEQVFKILYITSNHLFSYTFKSPIIPLSLDKIYFIQSQTGNEEHVAILEVRQQLTLPGSTWPAGSQSAGRAGGSSGGSGSGSGSRRPGPGSSGRPGARPPPAGYHGNRGRGNNEGFDMPNKVINNAFIISLWNFNAATTFHWKRPWWTNPAHRVHTGHVWIHQLKIIPFTFFTTVTNYSTVFRYEMQCRLSLFDSS